MLILLCKNIASANMEFGGSGQITMLKKIWSTIYQLQRIYRNDYILTKQYQTVPIPSLHFTYLNGEIVLEILCFW